MRMAIVIVPDLFMAILVMLRGQSLKSRFHIMFHQARFIFDGRQPRSGTHHKQDYDSFESFGTMQKFFRLTGQIDDMAVTACFDM